MREEANLEAFDILDLFCELLVVRLRLIEQEKDLPDDLKEAVATCIYAAKRMGELPELGQIKSQFAAKYGRGVRAGVRGRRHRRRVRREPNRHPETQRRAPDERGKAGKAESHRGGTPRALRRGGGDQEPGAGD